MNILTSELPNFVELEGIKYEVHTDFRNWIDIGVMLSERKDEIKNRIVDVLKKAYVKKIPPNIELAMEGIMKFYRIEEKVFAEQPAEVAFKKSKFSFDYDAVYVLSAFKEQFNIDLLNVKMHWFEFMAYFKSLNENVQLMKIIQYRSIDISQIKDKKQKAFYRKMKTLYALPDNRTQQEKEAEVINAFDSFF